MREPDVPFYQSERNFRRYENIIAAVVSNYPNPTFIQPKDFAVGTVCARLRDAINYLIKNPQWETKIDRGVLDTIMKENTVTHDGIKVRVGKKIKQGTQENASVVQVNSSKTIDKPTYEELQAYGLLVANGRLTDAYVFTNVNSGDAERVAFSLQDDPRIQFWQEGAVWNML